MEADDVVAVVAAVRPAPAVPTGSWSGCRPSTHVGLSTLEAGLAGPEAHVDVCRDDVWTWQDAFAPTGGRA